ncbi:DUF1684 domain-containing protein [candidate division KSB1 bacterium]|nr:DUF1684 domain-containing protein [candidate division KSB1 bacterium]
MKLIRMVLATAASFVIAAGIGCAKRSSNSPALVAELEQQRREKDRQFKHENYSPLPDSAKEHFSGLPYFPVDLKYRFEGAIKKFEQPDTLALATSDGRLKKALRYGTFSFSLEGRQHQLEVYRLLSLPAQYANYLFIPFTDLTSGEEAYGGGRYLDLEEQKDNQYVVDFNLAYNPSCAYGRKDFSCPVPPRSNALDVRIAAGEKNWKH